MSQLRNKVWGSIDTVLVIEGIIEHCADQFLFLGRFLGRQVDAAHVGEAADVPD